MTPRKFVEALSNYHLPNVFNPYAQRCAVHDRDDAVQIRRKNLLVFLESSIDMKVDTIWIARDLGYRGGRRTGVALTDEVHLEQMAHLLGGVSLRRATRGPIVAERTAAVVWKVLSRIHQPAFLWNVFPFHPYESNDHLSNRCHTRTERESTMPLLLALIGMFKAKRLVTIGRDAQIALKDIPIPVATVRHPSYGGQNEFISGLYDLYGVSDNPTLNLEFDFPAKIKNYAASDRLVAA